ncbi:RNA polymerase sigma-70 factor [Pedobacter sp. ASV28]|uniref:RNA polymerase sigma-70 factor n=1 Tax=Pedobacter sp. ASV28 TaxID=2795123 RepID=UPI0018EA8B69|nr:RNA polymerase sigma-70 factor [Pedobacter sp. ASV28]
MPAQKSKIALLFREIQYGNKPAFDELFVAYYDQLLAFAKQYTKQLESAEEITSELFVKIWLRRETLSNVLNPEVYLYVATKNACLNLIRSNKKRQQFFTEPPIEQVLEQIPHVYEMAMEDKELIKILDLAVASLPGQRQIIFKLVKEQGLKSSEVAQILDLSKRTVENQLYKAVKTLAAAISDYLGYHPQAKIPKAQVISSLSIFFF